MATKQRPLKDTSGNSDPVKPVQTDLQQKLAVHRTTRLAGHRRAKILTFSAITGRLGVVAHRTYPFYFWAALNWKILA